MRSILTVLVALMAALLPAAAFAQSPPTTDRGDFAMQVNGDYRLAPGESIGSVLVISGDVIISGAVRDTLIVIDGDVMVHGSVEGDVTVISGSLTLANGSTVHNVSLIRSDLTEQTGSIRTGELTQNSWLFMRGFWILFGILFVVGVFGALFLGGMVFAGIAGAQLERAGEAMAAATWQSIVAGIVTVIGLPIVAALAIASIVGIPLGLGILAMVMPALAFLGFIVAGAWLGNLILRRPRREGAPVHPFAETALGLVILEAVLLVPGFGFVAFLVLGTWGMGALVYLAWKSLRPGGPAHTEGTKPAAAPGGQPLTT